MDLFLQPLSSIHWCQCTKDINNNWYEHVHRVPKFELCGLSHGCRVWWAPINPTSLSLSSSPLHFNGHFSRWIWVSWYQNVSILNFIGAKDDGGGGGNWSCKTCNAPVKSSPPTNQHPVLLHARFPSCCQSVKALRRKSSSTGELLCQIW